MTLDPTTPLIECRGIGKRYADGNVQALQDIHLAIQAGEFVAIVGPSGGGKSTLLNMIGALDRPSSGEVFFEGQMLSEIADLDHFRSSKIGFVFQSYYLLPNLTAQENVQLGMFDSHPSAKHRATEAAKLLDRVGLSERAGHRPNQLSIGQRQRVAIARAIAGDPPLILADEPTGALDSVNSKEVMELLCQLREQSGSTLVVITHDERVAASADRVILINDGRIAPKAVLT